MAAASTFDCKLSVQANQDFIDLFVQEMLTSVDNLVKEHKKRVNALKKEHQKDQYKLKLAKKVEAVLRSGNTHKHRGN